MIVFTATENIYLDNEGGLLTESALNDKENPPTVEPVSLLVAKDCNLDMETAIKYGLMERSVPEEPSVVSTEFGRLLEGSRKPGMFDSFISRLGDGVHEDDQMTSMEWAFLQGVNWAHSKTSAAENAGSALASTERADEVASTAPLDTSTESGPKTETPPAPKVVDDETSVEDLELTDQQKNSLTEAGFDTLGKIRAAEDADLLKLKGIGMGTVGNLRSL